MRWWLSGVFVAIALVTAVLIAIVSSRQADRALSANAQSIAVGETVSAGAAVQRALAKGDLGHQLVSIGGQHGLALFVFSSDGRLYAQYGLRAVAWRDVPRGSAVLLDVLTDRHFVGSFRSGQATVVGLALHSGPRAVALVAYAPRPPAVSFPKLKCYLPVNLPPLQPVAAITSYRAFRTYRREKVYGT